MESFLVSRAAPPGTPSVDAEPSYLAEHLYFPFYDYLVARHYPTSWVPNKITLVGVAATLLSSCLLLCSMPSDAAFAPPRAELLPASLVAANRESVRFTPLDVSQVQPVLPTVFTTASLLGLCGVLNLLYCVADNTDGRLARRDRRTSVIGEYLDHGLDCVTSLLSAALAFCVLGAPISNMSISIVLIACVTVLSHTLHFERNIFIWGNRIASVDEAMILFGVCMWVPLAFPYIGSSFITEVPWLLAVDRTLHISAVFPSFLRLKGIDLVYIFYSLSQAQTIFSVVRHNWRMLFRFQVLFMVANGAVLLSLIPTHSANVAAHRAANGGGGGVPGYTLGRLTYPAVWIIAAACTCSIVVHVAIAARCAKMSRPTFFPLAGLVFVWFAFLTCPVGGAALAVAVHVGQVLLNVHYIQTRLPAKK